MATATPGTTPGPEAKRGTPAANGAGTAGAGPVARDRPPAGATAGRGRGRPSKADKRAETVDRLTQRFTRWAMLLMFLDDRTAVAVLRHSPNIAESATDVAERYPWAAKLLDGAASGGALIGFGGAVGMLGLEIAANHDLLPEPFNSMLKSPEGDDGAPPQGPVATEQPAPPDAVVPGGAGRLADLLGGLRA